MPRRRLASLAAEVLVKSDTSLQRISRCKIEFAKGAFILEKVPGCDKPAEILTKNVGRNIVLKHMEHVGLKYESGRAGSAPSIDH